MEGAFRLFDRVSGPIFVQPVSLVSPREETVFKGFFFETIPPSLSLSLLRLPPVRLDNRSPASFYIGTYWFQRGKKLAKLVGRLVEFEQYHHPRVSSLRDNLFMDVRR